MYNVRGLNYAWKNTSNHWTSYLLLATYISNWTSLVQLDLYMHVLILWKSRSKKSDREKKSSTGCTHFACDSEQLEFRIFEKSANVDHSQFEKWSIRRAVVSQYYASSCNNFKAVGCVKRLRWVEKCWIGK